MFYINISFNKVPLNTAALACNVCQGLREVVPSRRNTFPECGNNILHSTKFGYGKPLCHTVGYVKA